MLPSLAQRVAAACSRATGPLSRRPPSFARDLSSAVLPQALRRSFQNKDGRRDDALLPRMPAAVPELTSPSVQAWISAWGQPRVGIAQLRADVWTMPMRTDIVHRVVTWQRACMRQGTGASKGRHEVRGGGRKPRPQKGSGRSRQGSIRAPQWKGGGNAFPKRPRDFSYKLPLKVQSLGLKTALSDKYRRGALVVMRDYALASEHANPDLAAKLLENELADKLSALGVDLRKQKGDSPPRGHTYWHGHTFAWGVQTMLHARLQAGRHGGARPGRLTITTHSDGLPLASDVACHPLSYNLSTYRMPCVCTGSDARRRKRAAGQTRNGGVRCARACIGRNSEHHISPGTADECARGRQQLAALHLARGSQ